MTVWDVFILGVALSMDAFAVGMTDGMAEPKMRFFKSVAVAGAFGLFQAAMPLLGYVLGKTVTNLIAAIAPWLSFFILLILGGKAAVGSFREARAGKRTTLKPRARELSAGGLFMQAIATSIDALAVGVTLLAVETAQGLPFAAEWCALIIGVVTFALSLGAVHLGKRAGNALAEKAELAGGAVLILIGVKILAEGAF